MPYRTLIMSLLSEPSHFKLTVNSVDLTAPTGHIDIDIEVMENGADVSNMFLRMALTEDQVPYGASRYDDVTRDMLPDQAVTVSMLGQVQNVYLTFPVDAAWAESNLEIIAFLQDDTDQKVHASTSSKPNPDYCLRFYALGERQVVGSPSGSYNYGNFRVYNLGNVTDTYTVNLTGNVPAGWFVGLCDDAVCYGDTYSQQLAPGEFIELHLMVAPTSSGFATMTVEMSQANLAHLFPRALSYRYFTDDLDVLVVDDDGAETYETYFTDALAYNGHTFGIWDRLAGPTPTAVLDQFPVVIWATAFNFPTLDDDDREALGSYMDAGGSVFVTGQDIGWELNDIGGAAYQWYRNYLHANFIADDTNDYTLNGVPGDEISSGVDLIIQGGDGANNQDYPSDIDPADASANIIWTYDANRNGALKADTGTYRVVYMAFGYEAINNATDRRTAMQRIMNWLTYGPVAADALAPAPGAWLTSAPNPASARTTLKFNLPVAGEASLKVYGVDGRLLGTLLDEPVDSGTYSVDWDFTDSEGHRLPAGVYFYRLQGDGVDETRKILLIQ